MGDPVYDIIKNHKAGIMDLKECRSYAVTIPFLEKSGETWVVFEVRAQKIASQPGDVCLPGGAVEPGETPREAAVRETSEELLLPPERIELLGESDIYLTGKGRAIYPFAARLSGYEGTYRKEEVEEVFAVPLRFFLETKPDTAYTAVREIPEEPFPFEWIRGGRKYPFLSARKRIVFYRYEDRVIWGITGKIMEAFAKMLKKE